MELKCRAPGYPKASVSAAPSCLLQRKRSGAGQKWGEVIFFFLKNKHKYNCVLVCMYTHKVTAKLFPLRKICKVPKREKECLWNPIGIPSDRESFIHHLQDFRSRAVCPGEHTETTQCRNSNLKHCRWKHKVDVYKLLCTSLIR